MQDDEFLRRFEAAQLDTFSHADHVRAAWVYLERHSPEAALAAFVTALQRFARAKGAPDKFHYSVTRAWLMLIVHARHAHPEARSAQALLASCPALDDSKTIDRFYRADTLRTERARTAWAEPDRAPLHTITVNAAAATMPHADPIAQFHAAIEHALQQGIDPTPMTLATADARGRPSARMVLMRGADARGFVFHTNYTSRKARELTENPHAALCLHWNALEQQIRIEGAVARLPADESDAYFAGRPRGSQVGAWASQQSQVLPARGVLEERIREVEQRFEGQPVTRPPFWGGFRLTPERIEFWHGRDSRLHERLIYLREGNAWRTEHLYP